MKRRPLTPADLCVGVLATLAALIHVGAHARAGRPHDALWICNVASLLAGPAVLLRSPMLSAVSLTWLLPGTAIWLFDGVVFGAGILPTSYGAHLGGSAASIYAVYRSGHAPRGWIAALAVFAAVMLTSRIALPPHTNVNSTHAVPPGWDFMAALIPGSGFPGFMAISILCALASALGGHILGRAIGARGARAAGVSAP
jgi:hypothetical protein